MNLAQREENGRLIAAITGKCTVEHAAALREALLTVTSLGKPVTLDISGVEDADITFLQLLLATAQTLEKRGASLSREGPVSRGVGEAARISGFDQTPRLKPFFTDAG
jgi:anti-anti-sigma regulatory factor